MPSRALSFLMLALLLLVGRHARAGNNGYFTTYNSEVEQGEVEIMLMNDYTAPSAARRAQGQGDYLSHMLELEYGVTSQFATEFMIESFEDVETREVRFGGFRWENRYRLFERHVPLNPMLYVEYEDLDPRARYKMEVSGWVLPPYRVAEEGNGRERILEMRLVLSDKVGPLDVAFNAVIETDLSSGTTAFGYSTGVMWMPGHGGDGSSCPMPSTAPYACPMHPEETSTTPGTCPKCGMALEQPHSHGAPGCACRMSMPGCSCGHCSGHGGSCSCAHAGMVGVGLEAFGALGDSIVFGFRPGRQEHYLGPILMYHVTPRLMFHTQLAMGLTGASDELARLNIGYEF